MFTVTRSAARSTSRLPRLLPSTSHLALQRHSHNQPPATADSSEWIAYFTEKDARLARTERELEEMKLKLARMEDAHAENVLLVGRMREELVKRKTDYSMLTAVELVVEAAYRNGTITPNPDSPPSVIVSAINELQKDPMLTAIVEEACLRLNMKPEEAWEQLPTLYDKLAKKAGLMDSLQFSSGYELLH